MANLSSGTTGASSGYPYGGYPPPPAPASPAAAATTPKPTFAAPVALPAQDPRIAQLMAAMMQQGQAPAAPQIRTPDFSGINAQSAQLKTLLASLMAGKGPDVGPVDRDPEAKAYRVAALREGDASRMSEADRLGASGFAGSGDFDSRVAQLKEATGENIAQFEGALAGRKKQEAMTAATTGANLELADLGRQTSAEQSRFDAEQRQRDDQLAREDRAAMMDRSQKESLLSVLMAQQSQGNDLAFRQAAEGRAAAGENRTAAEFATTPAAKQAQYTPANPPPGTYWDPQRGFVAEAYRRGF